MSTSTATTTSDLRPQHGRRTRTAQAVLSAGSLALGTLLMTGLLGDPLARTTGLAALVPPSVLGVLLAGLAVTGLLTLLLRRPALVRAAAVVQVLGHLLAVSTLSLIALLGYLLAAAVPLGSLVLAVLVCRRRPVARWLVLLAMAVTVTWGWLTGVLAPTNVTATFGRVLVAMADRAGEMLLLLWFAVGALLGARRLAAALAGLPGWTTWERWLLAHQRGLTLLAAAGPLPYVLVRATWLTPWPLGAPFELDSGTRFWGLLLGCAGLVGSVLTVGLIRSWGSVAPRWLPGVAGRPVPVAAAVVPASLVSLALVVGAVPMVVGAFTELPITGWERLLSLLVFPFWVWGPALALATWAYLLRRREDANEPAAAG